MTDALTLGDFTLVEPIAQGGMGQVWRAEHTSGLVAAVKVMSPEGEARPAWIEALNAEIRAVAGLDHPHIVWIHDAGTVTDEESEQSGGLFPVGGPWLAMELAEQGTLKDVEVHDWDTARRLLEGLLSALAHAHSRGVVHRDIKPANILLDDEGQPKLTDFGMVLQIDPAAENPTLGGGTPSYMAPEQFEQDPWDIGPWTDLYSLGVVAYGLFSGRRPFRGSGWVQLCNAHSTRPVPHFDPLFEVPEGLWVWLLGMLEKDRHRRFQHAADALFALRQLDDETDISLPLISDGPTEVSFTEGRAVRPPFASPPLPEHQAEDPPRRDVRSVGLGLYGLRAMPFLGRSSERGALWQTLVRVHDDQRPRAVVLRGPAGVGKSRLALWLCQRAQETGGAEVFRTTHNPLPGPLDGPPGLLARAFRLRSFDRSTVERAVRTELDPVGLRDPTTLQLLFELLSPTGSAGLAPHRRHQLVARAVGALCRGRPAVIWLDDVQWGAEAIDLCDHLVTSSHAPSCMIVMTVRDEALVDETAAQAALDDLLEHRRVVEIEMGPLGRQASEALIERGLGLQAGLASRLQKRIAGNPMFAIELVGDWVERGLLVPGRDGFTLADKTALKLPTNVGALWARRIDRMLRDRPQDELPLTIAAALGLEVDPEEWRAACAGVGVEPSADLWEHLQEARLVRRDAETQRLGFVHGVLRETILERARHEGTLEPINRGIAASMRSAARRGLYLLSTSEYREGAALLLAEAGRSGEIGVRAALRLLQLRDEALEERDPDDPARIDGWIEAARVCRMSANARDGFLWARQAKRAAARVEDRERSVCALQECAANMRMLGNLERAQRYIDNAMALSDGLPDTVRGATLYECAAVLTDGGDLPGAERTIRRGIDLMRTADDRCRASTMLGYILAQEGFLEEAREVLLKTIPDAKKTGSRVRVADLHTALGEVARRGGDLEEAEKRYRKALQLVEGTGIEDPAFKLNLGLTLMARGRVREARELLEEVLEDTQAHQIRLLELVTHAALAALAADQGRWRELRRHLAVIRDDDTGLAADDLASCLQYAGTHALALEQARIGQMALQLAANQYRMLGQHERAERATALARRALLN